MSKQMTVTAARAGLARLMAGRPWLMNERGFHEALTAMQGERLTEAQAARAAAARGVRTVGATAVIPILGPIVHRGGLFAEYFGLSTIQQIRAQFRAAQADEEVASILFEIDSPGGEVSGLPELAAEIYAARGGKPMVAVANTMACSAALWLGVQADQFYVSPSGEAGSIGVWTAHVDESQFLEDLGLVVTLIAAGEHKVDGHSYAPLPEDVAARIQGEVDALHEEFIEAVAVARGTTAKAVRAGYGEGLIYTAKQAKKLGLSDGVATVDAVIAKLAGKKRPSGRRASVVVETAEAVGADVAGVAALILDPAVAISAAERVAALRADLAAPGADAYEENARLWLDLESDGQ